MTTEEFFEALYGDEPLPGSLVICRFVETGSSGHRCESRWCLTIGEAVETVERWSPEFDVYFGLALQKGPVTGWSRGSAATAIAIPGFAADIDYGNKANGKKYPPTADAALDLLHSLPCRPSLVVDSGGGLHSYWLFKEAWQFDSISEHDRAERRAEGWGRLLQQKAKAHGYVLDSTFDLARVLRPVGSLNHRYGEPRTVRVLEGPTHADLH